MRFLDPIDSYSINTLLNRSQKTKRPGECAYIACGGVLFLATNLSGGKVFISERKDAAIELIEAPKEKTGIKFNQPLICVHDGWKWVYPGLWKKHIIKLFRSLVREIDNADKKYHKEIVNAWI